MLDEPFEESQVHCPTVAGHPIMLARLGPPRMVKAHPRCALFRIQGKSHACPQPVFLRADHLQFKLGVWNASRHNCAPIIRRAKTEFVLCSLHGLSRRAFRPPPIQTRRRGYGLKHLWERRLDGKVMKYVGHCLVHPSPASVCNTSAWTIPAAVLVPPILLYRRTIFSMRYARKALRVSTMRRALRAMAA